MEPRSLIPVGIAEMKIARAPDILISYGLGSCVGIVIYDRSVTIAALAHTLLPAPREREHEVTATKFSSTAVDVMVAELTGLGAVRENLAAKLAGGSHMFDTTLNSYLGGIGERNLTAAREALKRHAIPVISEDTGGNYGRTVEFDPSTRELHVRSLKGIDRKI
jgi:chemotaxis protein CheD